MPSSTHSTRRSIPSVAHRGDRKSAASADVRTDVPPDVRTVAMSGTRALIRRIVAACRTAPRKSRPDWVQDLETDLLAEKSVTVERMLRLLLVSERAGADVTDAMAAFEDAIGVDAPAIPPLPVALVQETDAECAANMLQARALDRIGRPGMTVSDYDLLLSRFHQHRDALDIAIRAVARERLHVLRSDVCAPGMVA